MASDPNLSRIENENGLVFGLKWSLVGFAIALCFLAGCASLFESGSPRYNTVQGPKRVPVMNPASAVSQQPPAPMQPSAYNAAQQQQMMQDASRLFAVQQQQQANAAAYQAQPLPQQSVNYQQQPIPSQSMNTMPTLPATHNAQGQPLMSDASIEAEISALERDLAASQAQRGVVSQQQQADGGWLPDLGVSDWFGGNNQAATQPMPVRLPAPPAGVGVPPMTSAMPPHTAANGVDVPLAPSVRPSAPTNVPVGLLPPSDPNYPGSGYLQDSRYSNRNYQQRPY